MEGDGAYFGRRAVEERTAAMKSVHPNVRKTHLDMAARYAELAQAISAREKALGLDQPIETWPPSDR